MTDSPWQYMGGDVDTGWDLSDRDLALGLLNDIDLEAQLMAVRGLLRRNKEAEQVRADELREIDRFLKDHKNLDPEYRMHVEDQWVDAHYLSVYQDAAHSMAAVGMLAPMLESLLVAIFVALRDEMGDFRPPSTADQRRDCVGDDYWDPHFVYSPRGRRKNLVEGTTQLAASVGLDQHLPETWRNVLSALFAYRNRMFHHGFEWPVSERKKFAERLSSGDWQEGWFHHSSNNGEPWAYYMSAEFIEHALKTIDGILVGVGAFRKDLVQAPD